ncbi:5322_t:CDS:2 [Gigaspora margarita]|uniref:5322_t:CDS:1 n=1 Tax=Gigaspora margarita TaxID=4874 RepID=A0ABN7WD39_GIGMA|nr:5322_t:CDS:2 [Gigaspora margarita]
MSYTRSDRLFQSNRISTNQSESVSFVTTRSSSDPPPTYEEAIVQQDVQQSQDDEGIKLLHQTILDYKTRLNNY